MDFLERRKLKEIITKYLEADEKKKPQIYNGIISKLEEINLNAKEFLEVVESCSDLLRKGKYHDLNNQYNELEKTSLNLEKNYEKLERENKELKTDLEKVNKLRRDLSNFLDNSETQ